MMTKRFFDLFFSLLGVLLLSPLFLFVGIWIKSDSKGPVFFRQERVGQYGKLFRIYKFRTMSVEKNNTGRQITVGADSRITKAGRFLRKSKIDELPQLLNVIKGEMSLVGPRPEVPRYVAYYPSDVRNSVLSLLPGITDYASILFRDESTLLSCSEDPEKTYVEVILPQKLSHYQRYVEDRSLWGDVLIILRTFLVILSREK